MAEKKIEIPEDFATVVGCRIREAREAADLSQKAMGKMLDQTDRTISSWEKGRTKPTIVDLKGIAVATGKDVRWFLDTEKPDPHAESRADMGQGATTPEEIVRRGRSVSESHGPAAESAEFLGGYFEVGQNKITIDIIVRGPEERARLGGYREKGSEDS